MMGQRITTLREEILTIATDQAFIDQKSLDDATKEIKIHGKKIRARGQNEEKAVLIDKENPYIEPTIIDRRRKGRNRGKLSLSEKIKIIH